MAWWKRIGFCAGLPAVLFLPSPANAGDAAQSFQLGMRHIFALDNDGGILTFDNPFHLDLSHARGAANVSGASHQDISGTVPANAVFSLFSSAYSNTFVAVGDETAVARGEGYGTGSATTYFVAPAAGQMDPDGSGTGSASATTATETSAIADAEAEASGTATLSAGIHAIGISSTTSSQANVAAALGPGVSENFDAPNGSPARWAGTAESDLGLIYRLDDSQNSVISPQPGVPGLNVLARGEKTTDLAVMLNGDATQIATTATNAPGVAFTAASASQAGFAARLRGRDSAVSTGGNGSPAIMAGLVGLGDVKAALSVEGGNASLHTWGQSAPAAWLATHSLGARAASELALSGVNSAARTEGDNSPTAILSANGADDASADALLSGRGARLSSRGNGSPAAVMTARAGSDAGVRLSLAGRNSTVSTTGNASAGAIAFADAADRADGEFELGGVRSKIETTGDDSVGGVVALQGASVRGNAVLGPQASITTSGSRSGGLLLHGSGPEVSLGVVLSGPGARIQTAGDHSYGAALFTTAGSAGTTSVELSGERSGISTRGAAAPGAVLTSAGGTGGAALTLSGADSYIATQGDRSNGVYLAGDNTSVRLSGKGSRITSMGGEASAILVAGNDSRFEADYGTHISAGGAGSYGIRYLDPTHGHRIDNAGTIGGNAGGISGGAGLFVQNRAGGVILGANGPAVAGDFGTVWNSGRIVGKSGITFGPQTNGNTAIVNSGLIASNSGPSGVAIDLRGSGDDLLRLSANALTIGTIDLGAGDDRLEVDPGANVHLTFQTPPETVDAGKRPTFLGASGRNVIIVDPTALSPTSSLFGWLQRTLSAGDLTLPGLVSPAPSLPVMRFAPEWPLPGQEAFDELMGSSAAGVWIKPIGGAEYQAGGSDRDSVRRVMGGLMFGAVFPISASTDLMFQGGYAHMRETTTGAAQNNRADAFFGRVSAKTDMDDWDLGWSVLGAYGLGNTSRLIANNTLDSGFEVSDSRHSGVFAAVSGSASKEIALSDTVTFTPAAGATLAWSGPVSYTETGSTADITYASGSKLSLEGRLQGGLTKRARFFDRMPANLHFDGGVFLTGDISSSGRTVEIGGSRFRLDEKDGGTGGVFGGVSADLPLSSNGLFTLGAEVSADTGRNVGFAGWLRLHVSL